jgi:hypothetical protein
MKKQEAVDIISFILCTERFKSIIIFGETINEAEYFFRSQVAERIPVYVGLKRVCKGCFETKTGSRIYCLSTVNSARGRNMNLAVILEGVKNRVRHEVLEYLTPIAKHVIEVDYEVH